MVRFLAIDPSVNELGWSHLEVTPGMDFNQLANYRYGVIRPKGETLAARVMSIRTLLPCRAGGLHLVAEWPEFHQSERGRVAARQGDTLKVAAVVGYLIGLLNPTTAALYTPGQWKGQVPKEVTRYKFWRTFTDLNTDTRAIDHNALDAIMLLRHHLTETYGIK